MLNPFRREQDAFRMLVAFVAGAAVVIAVTLASEPVYGVVVGAALLGFGAGTLWSDLRRWQADGGRAPAREADEAGGLG
jgi:hypothetical protein